MAGAGSRYWLFNYTEPGKQYTLQQKYTALQKALVPSEGKTLPVSFQGVVKTLAEAGVIDVDKWRTLYAKRKVEVPEWITQAFSDQSSTLVHIDPMTASLLLNIFWAVGISNKTQFNEQSPLQGKKLPNFASTGGWSLGKEKGAAYFNQVTNITLNEAQENLVRTMADQIYRPCCNNSTFFQDCNHGSAMLGLLELGASQGKSEEDLYAMAFAANIYWFPDNYVKLGMYFQAIEGKQIEEIPPQTWLSRDFSSAQGFRNTVLQKLAKNNLLPGVRQGGAGGCSV